MKNKYSFDGFSPVKRRMRPFQFDMDGSGNIIAYDNTKLSDMLGISLSDSDIGLSVYEYVNRWDIKNESLNDIKKSYGDIISEKTTYFEMESETPFYRRDGFPLHIHLSAHRFGDEIRSAIRDESTEARRSRERKELLQGLANLSHDMRSQIIKLGTELMKVENEIDDPEIRRYIDLLKGEVMGFEEVFSTLIMLARDKYKVKKSDISIYEEVIIPSIDPFFSELEEKNIDIAYDRKLKRKVVYSDARLLKVIFRNYFSNAAKYTPEGGSIYCGTTPRDNEDWFNVMNTGEPIPDDMIDEIFKPFVRGERASGSEMGYGIGLASSSKAARTLGERIWAEKGREDGANFFVSIKHKKIK